ncbi:MAG: SPOR domain-containing protein [Proteobacteria bacterium]|nr:SPOR domain-containing protein [Luminiphilus sp.]MDA0650372.1 SPOR domain-containing protein [Pseudomonadota bacterium]
MASAAKPVKKPSATRSQKTTGATEAPPTLSAAHFQGFAVGLIAGILASIVFIPASESPVPATESLPMTTSAGQVDEGPRFDFYTVLPNQELDLNPDIEPADLQSRSEGDAQYLLQVGSFRQQADADRRRGELALLGLEATVEAGDSDSGRWHRVYLGPFESRSDMARARALTAQADMDTLLLKREAPSGLQ